MTQPYWSVLVICTALANSAALAYDIPTHYDLSQTAVTNSVLDMDPTFLASLGLADPNHTFPATPATVLEGNPNPVDKGCTHGQPYIFSKLIACGAEFEDVPGLRSLNHFYDPVHGIPLTVAGVAVGQTSPDWAIKDGNVTSNNVFSYKDAHDYFYRALTTTTSQTDRDTFWGELFQSMGQIIHHVQDMAQPQHVRNDEHVDYYIPGLYNPSLYEAYTSGNRGIAAVIMAGPGSGAVYTASNPNGFKLARDFWNNTGGTGIAQFTNGYFVSAGTNFQLLGGQPVTGATYTYPQPGVSEDVSIQNLTPAVSPNISAYCGTYTNCNMTFYSSVSQNGATQARASTLSIFDQNIQFQPVTYFATAIGYYQSNRVFTLNSYNFDAVHPQLLPRAVAYSAGLINYFFRGKMNISLPKEGIYSINDTANTAASSGFTKIRLQLQNTTPVPVTGGAPQDMTGGTVIAVAKYHLNTCYANASPVLSDPLSVNGDISCRSKAEYIAVSTPQTGVSLPAGASPMQLPDFDFTVHPIPLNAIDLYLQVVYRGPLGSEQDAVVVTTKDISEPTFVTYHNDSDYSVIAGHVYTRAQINGSQALLDQVQPRSCIDNGTGLLKSTCLQPFVIAQNWVGSDGSSPLFAVAALPVLNYVRVAVLIDANSDTAITDLIGQCQPATLSIPPTLTELDVAHNSFHTSLTAPYRGPYGWFNLSCVTMGDGSVPGSPDDRDTVIGKRNDGVMTPVQVNVSF